MFGDIIVVNVNENQLELVDLKTGQHFLSDGQITFSNSRLLIAQFDAAVRALKMLIRQWAKGRFLPPAPIMVIGPQKYTQDLSSVEEKCFTEFGMTAGASQVIISVKPIHTLPTISHCLANNLSGFVLPIKHPIQTCGV